MFTSMKLKSALIILAILLPISFFLGLKIGTGLTQGQAQTTAPEVPDKYPYLARRIFLEDPNDVIINFTSLRRTLQDYVAKFPQKIGVYFEYLPTGNSIGINEKEIFYAASLLKIPMAMAVYKEMELGNISMDEKLTIKLENINKEYGELWKTGAGAELTVKDALKQSVVESDNTAYLVLRDKVKDKNLEEVFNYLDIPRDNINDRGGVSPKNYASILRSLYFSAFLSFENSSSLLELMSVASKNDLLRRGVPREITISNKYGVYSLGDTSKQVYSDCGIVYYPKRNYILCVMLDNTNDEDLADTHIGRISRTVYEFVKSTATKR